MGVNYALYSDVTLVAPIPWPSSVQPRVEEYITQASARLRALVLGLDNRLADGSLEAELVKGVVVDSVLRLTYNPTGAQSQTAGPFNVSKSGGIAADNLMFDPAQLAALLAPGETVPSTFGVSVALIPGVPAIHGLPGMPFPGAVGSLAALDAFRGYPYTPESVRAFWAAYGPPPWGY
jgi:hypothetical protein